MSDSSIADSSARPIPDGYEAVYDSGFNAYIGSIYKDTADVGATDGQFLFDVEKHHLNAGQMIHGGLLMTLADTALGSTVAHTVGHMCSTITLNCDFLAGAGLGDRIEITTEVSRKTRSVVFVNGTLSVDRRILMTASGIWKIVKRAEA